MTSMLLATAICFGFVIKMCTAATNTSSSDLSDDVFVCVKIDPAHNATTITWTIAAYVRATCCDLTYSENKTSVSVVVQNLPPTGTFDLTNLRESVLYVAQMTCFVSSCNGPDGSRKNSKSSLVSFYSGMTGRAGSHVNKVCSKSHPSYLTHGLILVCIQETLGVFTNVVQWWSSQPYSPSSCTLYYTTFDTMEIQHRTETFRNLPMNSSMFLREGASDVHVHVWMECNDSNNEMQSSGIVKYTKQDSVQRVCSSVGPVPTLPITAKTLPTEPTHYRGLHVSSLAQGLVLAFGIVIVSLAMSLLAYRRYKSYMRRRSQRLLRIETEEEANEDAAMHEFQRMV